INKNFGAAPRGLWLTERIWEPHLPKILAASGVEYVMVDDSHFISAGISGEKLCGYYITEEEGLTLKVFPISKTLRYLIPFKQPEETIKYLESIAKCKNAAAILADDGEKFGVWPGTHKWVYQDGYLEKLLTLLEENSSWINFMTFSEYLDEYPPLGRTYLPTASYKEMMEWSLPTVSGKKLEKITREIKHSGKEDEYGEFIKGGFFRNFFVKYPESNNMHKRMLQVSQRLQSLKKAKTILGEGEKEKHLREAQKELYKGQCNCAYWHGVFGGLYLNYLRHAIYENLIGAETLIDKYSRGKDDFLDVLINDFDKDGSDEIIFSNNLLNLYISPNYGGSIFELDYKPKRFNLLNTLARREETYHSKIKDSVPENASASGAATIHEISRSKEKGLEELLDYDWHRRLSLMDHFLAEGTTLDGFSRAKYEEVGDFTIEPYDAIPRKKGSEASIVLRREGSVKKLPIKVEKSITIFSRQSIISIDYEVTNLSSVKADLWFGVEFNFSLLAGRAPDRYYESSEAKIEENCLASKGELPGISSLKLVDNWKRFVIVLETNNPANFWRFPIETISQSEAGFEKNFQSSVVFPNWKVLLEAGESWKTKLTLRIEE
ncbi:MAG: alpha-amylase/4-alpha-glucanotransferase domain-containing protein, partial [Candidatus Margulisiibacteriota bacterium]